MAIPPNLKRGGILAIRFMNLGIIAIMVLAVIFIAIAIRKYLIKLRYRNAFRAGRYEHRFSRICFGFILLTWVFNYQKKFDIATITNTFALVSWLLYFIFHSIEKKLFPKVKPSKR